VLKKRERSTECWGKGREVQSAEETGEKYRVLGKGERSTES